MIVYSDMNYKHYCYHNYLSLQQFDYETERNPKTKEIKHKEEGNEPTNFHNNCYKLAKKS